MLDAEETDWKVIVFNSKEADEKSIETLEDLERHSSGVVSAAKNFFTVYKIPSGKPANVFAYNGEVKDRNLATDVIMYWKF